MDYAVPFSNGCDRSNDETRLAEGYARVITNAMYSIDDPDRLTKIPGRTSALTLGSPQTTTPYGLAFFQFDSQASQLVLLANGQLYRQNSGTTLGSWTSVNDQQGSPAAFARAGTFLKSIPDSLGRWISWTGATSERPLLHFEDGYTRFLGLLPPSDRPTVTALTATPTVSRATSGADAAGTVTLEGSSLTFSGAFANKGNAFDGDTNTQSSAVRTTAGITGVDFSFAAGTASSTALYVSLSTTSLPSSVSDPRQVTGNPSGSIRGKMYVQVSTNSGSTYTTVFVQTIPLTVTNVQYNLTDGTVLANFRVRVILRYISGTGSLNGNVIEVYLQSQNSGGASLVPDGTYYYAITEIHQHQVGDFAFTVESEPSDVVTYGALLNNTTIYGFKLTFPTKSNSENMGIDAANHRWGIYRSTSTGFWPDLGRIATAPITQTTFTDNFTLPLPNAITLGAPGLNIGYAGIQAAPIAGVPPAIFDATMTQSGIIVAVPAGDRFRIVWNMPGFPDYWPEPHGIIPASSERFDRIQGITSIGDAILVFLRSRVIRLVRLPVMNRPNFDIAQIQRDVLSPKEGLAGGPLSYCHFTTQEGRAAVAWVSDNGVWWTDGTLVSERGAGISKMSVNMNWRADIDTTKLDQTRLIYDPVLQVIYFDYIDQSGVPKTDIFQVHPDHWVTTGQDLLVPKLVGQNAQPTGGFIQRALGEQTNGGFNLWALTSTKIFNERTGTTNDGALITTTIQSGWLYPAGAMSEFDIFYAGIYHSDWGSTPTCTLQVTGRRDQTQNTQVLQRTVSLSGSLVNRKFMHLSGQSCKIEIQQTGETVSSGTPYAFGPVVLDLEGMGELEKD